MKPLTSAVILISIGIHSSAAENAKATTQAQIQRVWSQCEMAAGKSGVVDDSCAKI